MRVRVRLLSLFFCTYPKLRVALKHCRNVPKYRPWKYFLAISTCWFVQIQFSRSKLVLHMANTSCTWPTLVPQVKRSRVRRITDPSTPDMRVTCVTLDPLAHLCSPMSPLRLDPHSDAEADAEAGTSAPLEVVEAATARCRATKKLKDTELLEPVVVTWAG